MEQKSETAPRRAWSDTKEWVIGNNFKAWLVVSVILAVVAPMTTALLTPLNTTRLMNGIYGFIGALLALFVAVLAVYIYHLIVTPYRQRDEARNEVGKLNKYINDLAKTKLEYKLEIEVGEVIISPDGIVKGDIALRPTKKMQLSKIILECDNKQTEGIIQGEKLPHYIEGGVNYKLGFRFFESTIFAGAWYIGEQMRLAHEQGRSEARLRVIADAAEWLSPVFFVPTKLAEPMVICEYSIGKMGDLTLEKQPRGYRIALTFSILYKNRDTRKPMWISNWARIGFDTFLSDGTREPYQMQSITGGTIDLKPGEDKIVDYELEAWNFDAEPVLPAVVRCHWDEMGRVRTGNGNLRPLKLFEPFDVNVHRITPPQTS